MKNTYLTLDRSQLLYCSQVWRPTLIVLLEKIQRRAAKYILADYDSNYKSIIALDLLPLIAEFELNDIMFCVKSLRSQGAHFDIDSFVSFCQSHTQSEFHLKMILAYVTH